MIVAAAQFTAQPLDIDANAATMADLIRAAGTRGAHVIVFPELALTGYELDAVIADSDRFALSPDDERLSAIRTACRESGVAALIGCPGRTTDGITISAFVYGSDGALLTRYDKRHVTDSERSAGFSVGTVDGRFTVDDTTFGIAICYDAHFPDLAVRAAADGCHILLASSLYGKTVGVQERMTIFPALAKDNDLHVLLSNHIGPSGPYDACGGSAIWAPDGTCLVEGSFDGPDLVLVEL